MGNASPTTGSGGSGARHEPPRAIRFWRFFGSVWGIVALLLAFWRVMDFLVLALPFITSFHSIPLTNPDVLESFVAAFLSVVPLMAVYALRWELQHYTYARDFSKPKRPSLYAIALILLALGLLLVMTRVSVDEMWPSEQRGNQGAELILARIILPLVYGSIFFAFTTGSSLMSATVFVRREETRPGGIAPRIKETNDLSRDVLQAVKENLEAEPDEFSDPLGKKLEVVVRAADVERLRDGGVRMTVERIRPDGIEESSPDKFEEDQKAARAHPVEHTPLVTNMDETHGDAGGADEAAGAGPAGTPARVESPASNGGVPKDIPVIVMARYDVEADGEGHIRKMKQLKEL